MRRSHDTRQSSRSEGTDRPRRDEFRRRASSSKSDAHHAAAQHNEHKSLDIFKNTFDTIIRENRSSNGKFFVQSKIKSKEGVYENIYNVNEGKILGRTNYKRDIENWHLSDVVYYQLQLVLQKAEKDHFNLTNWYGENVRNRETRKIAEDLLPEGKTSETFYKGSEKFNTLAQTPTAKSKFYLLKDYPDAFPGKQVTSITVIRHSDGQIDIEYQFGP